MNELVEKRLKWLIENRKVVFSVLAIVFLSSLLSFRLLERRKGNLINHFIDAERLFHQWKAFPQDEKLSQLNELIKKFPQLHAKYTPLIAQSLLSHQKAFDSSLINKLLKRTEVDAPFSSQFAKISYLLSQQDYATALEQTVDLKGRLNGEGYEMLYMYNLLRLALLQKETGSAREEFIAWKELEKYMGSEEETSPSRKKAVRLFEANFLDQSISLRDYIKYRKSFLSID